MVYVGEDVAHWGSAGALWSTVSKGRSLCSKSLDEQRPKLKQMLAHSTKAGLSTAIFFKQVKARTLNVSLD